MVKSGGYSVWIEAGYELFAHDGYDGIQVERIARILGLNKSGFYHYFGDRDSYFEQMMKHHLKVGRQIVAEVSGITNYDPEYLNILVRYPLFVMANMQLVRNRHFELFNQTYNEFIEKIEEVLLPLWRRHLGLNDQPEVAKRYHDLVRDMLYSRISFENLNYDFFHGIATETRTIIKELQHEHVEEKVAVNVPNGNFLRQA